MDYQLHIVSCQQVISFEVYAYDPIMPVKVLKLFLERQVGIPIANQKLIHRGKELENDKTLGTYDIKNNDEIFLMIGKENSAPATYILNIGLCSPDQELIYFKAYAGQANITVKGLKFILCHKTQMQLDDQRVIHNGRILEDDKTLAFYGIKNPDTVFVIKKDKDFADKLDL